MAPARAIVGRTFADSRVRNFSFAFFFALLAYVQPVIYRHSFPTLAERLNFARSFGDEKTVRFFYGVPHDLLSVGGYAAWRVGGIVSIFAAMWALLAAVRALRAEEDAGRQELVLAGIVTRPGTFASLLIAIGAGGALLWLALVLGLVAARLPAGQSAYLALATVSPLPVFVGVGALVSQLAPTRRLALEISSAALVVALLMRIVADTASSLDWLRWVTPLGWVEELRPFAGPRPAVLLAPLLVGALLLVASGLIAVRRDVGSGLLASSDSAAPRLRLLSSPTAQSLRSERGSLIGWLVGVGFFALIVGMISNTISSANLPSSLQQQLHKLGAAFNTPSDALGFYFLFFVLATALFACSQIAAARREEAEQRLETLFALTVSRRSWFAGRLVIASAATAVLAITAGVLAWAGAEAQGARVSLPRMLEAGANCLPTALLFLGLGALAFALLPRAAAGVAYGLVSIAFVWQLFGSLLGAPAWTVDLSPFHQVGLVPAEPLKAVAAVIMLAIATVASLAAMRIFERRDLTGT